MTKFEVIANCEVMSRKTVEASRASVTRLFGIYDVILELDSVPSGILFYDIFETKGCISRTLRTRMSLTPVIDTYIGFSKSS